MCTFRIKSQKNDSSRCMLDSLVTDTGFSGNYEITNMYYNLY